MRKYILLLLFITLSIFCYGQTNPYCSTYTTHAPISLTGVSNQTITGLSITGTQGLACIRLTNCDHIRIYNNILNGNSAIGQDPNRFGVVTVNCHDVQIIQCNITNCSNGIYFTSYSGATANLRADSNYIQNVKGPYPKGVCIQFNQISGAGCSASYNNIENLAGVSAPQDNISCFQSNGTAASNIIIQHNNLLGTGVTNATNSGVILGDGGGSYQSALFNTIVNAAHVELAIVGGNNMTAYGNTLLTNSSTIINPVLVQVNNATYPTTTCTNVVLQNNQGQNTRGSATYFPGSPFNCSPFTNISNNFTATINPNILPNPLLPGCTVAAPVLSYSPNTYVFYINAPISPISIINGGGACSSFSISPLQSAGLNFSSTSATISGTPVALNAGTTYTVSGTNAGGQNATTVKISVVNVPPNINYNPNSQVCIKGTNITNMPVINTGGSVVSFTCTPLLPSGLAIGNNGTIQGTPTALSPLTTYTIIGFNTGGSSTTHIMLTVNPPAVAPPTIAYSPNTYIFPINVPTSTISPVSTGGLVASYSISPSLPASLNFDTTLGSVSGTPTVNSSTTAYTVTAHNASGNSTAPLTLSVITVLPAPPSIVYNPASVALQINQPSPLLIPINTGGTATGGYSISPSLPASMSINSSSGVISGTPGTLLAPTVFTVTATNTGGSGSFPLTLSVVQASPGTIIRIGGKQLFFVN